MAGLPKSCAVARPVVELETTQPGEGTATRPERAPPWPPNHAEAAQAAYRAQMLAEFDGARRLILRGVRREGHEAVIDAREGPTRRREFRFPAYVWEGADPLARIRMVGQAWLQQQDEERAKPC